MDYKVVKNTELNGLEVVFPQKPPENVRQLLKSMGYRWSMRKGIWYNRYSEWMHQRTVDELEKHLNIPVKITKTVKHKQEKVEKVVAGKYEKLEPIKESKIQFKKLIKPEVTETSEVTKIKLPYGVVEVSGNDKNEYLKQKIKNG